MPSASSKRSAVSTWLRHTLHASFESRSFRSKYTWPDVARTTRDTSPSTLTRPRPPSSSPMRRVNCVTVHGRAVRRQLAASIMGPVGRRAVRASMRARLRGVVGGRLGNRRESGNARAPPAIELGARQEHAEAPVEERRALVAALQRALLEQQ